jgi:hypothetical protein
MFNLLKQLATSETASWKWLPLSPFLPVPCFFMMNSWSLKTSHREKVKYVDKIVPWLSKFHPMTIFCRKGWRSKGKDNRNRPGIHSYALNYINWTSLVLVQQHIEMRPFILKS